jgi:hypothetical protein
MKKIILFAVSLLCVASARAQQPSTGAADAGVPVEEYVPKVIIEGKWGTGPGEFGKQDGYERDDVPSSLAVDSKGNIYVLDYVNNRIQKFSEGGKHLLDIPADGFVGKIVAWNVLRDGQWFEERRRPDGLPEKDLRPVVLANRAVGVNIVIDSKDTLYYYLKRIKDGKETGEAWEFRNDKLFKKHIGKSPEPAAAKTGQTQITVDKHDGHEIAFLNLKGRHMRLKPREGGRFFDDAAAKKRHVSNRVVRGKDGLLSVVSEEKSELWTNYYSEDGVLVKRFRWRSLPSVLGYSNDGVTMYLPEVMSDTFKITKYERRVVK